MTKKIIILGLLSFSSFLNSMDLQSSSRKSSPSTLASSRGNDEAAGKGKVARLNLENLAEPLSLSSCGKKKSIKKLDHVHHLKVAHTSYRESASQGGVTPIHKQLDSDIRIEMDGLKKPSIVIDDLADIRQSGGVPKRGRMGSVHDELDESEKKMWDLLEKANPAFFRYAQENDLSIDDVIRCPYSFDNISPHLQKFAKKRSLPLEKMMEYAHLLENFEVEPEALAAFIHDHHEGECLNVDELTKYYEDMQKKNAAEYIGLQLDFITRTCSDDGKKEPSPLHATHVAAQNQVISDKKKQILYQYAGIAAGVIMSIAMGAWGAYNQATHQTGGPTISPTMAPTHFPTAPI